MWRCHDDELLNEAVISSRAAVASTYTYDKGAKEICVLIACNEPRLAQYCGELPIRLR